MYYWDEINGAECATYEEAEESVMEAFDDDEIIDRAMRERLHDVLGELRRLDSPLYWELFEVAKTDFLNDYLIECEDEEDEEPCCEECDHFGSHGNAINQPCMWCEEYNEFERKRFV